MTRSETIDAWHEVVRTRSVAGLDALLADDVAGVRRRYPVASGLMGIGLGAVPARGLKR